jgi:hypothetical protein
MWQRIPGDYSFYNKSRNMMSLSGNDRSLSSMENKWRQVTGLHQFSQSELQQEQQKLGDNSPFRKGQNRAGGWTRLDDNVLRRVYRCGSTNDWNKKRDEWKTITEKDRSAKELEQRWNKVLKVQYDPFSKLSVYCRICEGQILTRFQ